LPFWRCASIRRWAYSCRRCSSASQRRHSSTDPKPRLPDLVAKVAFRRELLADVLVGLFDLIEHLLVRHLDRRITLRLLHQDLELDQAVENLPAHHHPAR